jgi:hypothetical protein
LPIGRTYSPISGKVKKNSVTDVVADVESFDLEQMVASGTNSPRRREKTRG